LARVTATAGGGVSPVRVGVGSIGTLTMSSLNMTNGDLKIDFGATTDNISVSGAANFAGANTITPTGAAVTGTYTILNAAGGVTGGNTLTLGSFPFIPDSRPASGVIVTHANDVQVQVTGAKVLTWTGATDGTWGLGAGGPLNWQDPTPTPERFFNADTVAFTDAGANRTITLNNTIQPGNVTFTHSGGAPYVVSGTGSIIGLTGVTMSGGGQATIATNNTFTGQVRVTSGRLTLSGSNTPATIKIEGAGQLVASGAIATGSTQMDAGDLFIGDGGASGSVSGPIVNSGFVHFNRTDNFTHAGASPAPAVVSNRSAAAW
jgi:hypothetical protein